jgi:hypothetical protein
MAFMATVLAPGLKLTKNLPHRFFDRRGRTFGASMQGA